MIIFQWSPARLSLQPDSGGLQAVHHSWHWLEPRKEHVAEAQRHVVRDGSRDHLERNDDEPVRRRRAGPWESMADLLEWLGPKWESGPREASDCSTWYDVFDSADRLCTWRALRS